MKSSNRFLASSAVVTICLVLASHAYAASGPYIGGLSSDGSVYLSENYDPLTGTSVYRLVSTSTGAAQDFVPPSGVTSFYVTGLSSDGKAVTGAYYEGGREVAFQWTADGGYVDLGSLGGTQMQGRAVSADGSAVTGYGTDAGARYQAFYWTKGSSAIAIGTLGGDSAYGYGISGNGQTVVGTSYVPGNAERHAFVWNVGDFHPTDLGAYGIYHWSEASLVSFDGSVVVGQGDGSKTFRWTAGSGLVEIGTLGGSTANATAISNDGNVIVGNSNLISGDKHAFRYVHSDASMSDLGTLGGTSSSASDVTADGLIVVGSATDSTGQNRGFRWSQATGMLSIEDWLASAGITPGSDLSETAKYVSDDGRVVIGATQSEDIYVARYVEADDDDGGNTGGGDTGGGNDGHGSGMIKMSEYLPTLSKASSVSVQTPLFSANTIMFGAQGNPMRNLLSTGQRSVWGTVDAGHDDGDASDGNFVLGDFGFGYGLREGVTARFSAGGLYSDQDLDTGGSVRQKGFYLSPEVSADLGSNVFMTLGGYWGRSSIDSNRGYLNGGSIDYSSGDTDAQTWGAKIRFDWLNALSIQETEITPYVGLSYAHTKVDAYTETGGSFPVSYDESSSHATIARLGADFVHPVTAGFRLLAKTEAAYQFEDETGASTGTIVGIDSFSLAGQDLKQFWVRGGIGGEVDIAGGTASLMLNVTTQGQDPDVWVRSNWTVKF